MLKNILRWEVPYVRVLVGVAFPSLWEWPLGLVPIVMSFENWVIASFFRHFERVVGPIVRLCPFESASARSRSPVSLLNKLRSANFFSRAQPFHRRLADLGLGTDRASYLFALVEIVPEVSFTFTCSLGISLRLVQLPDCLGIRQLLMEPRQFVLLVEFMLLCGYSILLRLEVSLK